MGVYSIKTGDNLWNIVKKEFNLKNSDDIAKKVQEVARKNNIKNPDSIFAGQKISLDIETEGSPVIKASNDIAPLKVEPVKFDLSVDKSFLSLASEKINPQKININREFVETDPRVHGPNPGMDSYVPSADVEAAKTEVNDDDVKIKRYSASNPSFLALKFNKYQEAAKRIQEAIKQNEQELKLSEESPALDLDKVRTVLDEIELPAYEGKADKAKNGEVVVSSPKPVTETNTEPEVKVRKVKGAEITSPVKVTNKAKSKPRISSRKSKLHNIDVTQKYTGTAEQLNLHLKGVLKGTGSTLLRLQEKYGISAAFLAAIAINESANGSSYSARKRNNVGGVRKAGSTKFKVYKSVDDCLEDMAKFLKKNYIDQGRTTVGRVGAKYCPTSDHTDTQGINQFWPRNVGTYMAQIDPSVKDQV